MNICIDFRDSGKRIFEREMKEGKRMDEKEKEKINLEEKMKLNLFMSIYNTEELINLIKEYNSKFDENKVMLESLKIIRGWQEDRFNELNEGGKKG